MRVIKEWKNNGKIYKSMNTKRKIFTNTRMTNGARMMNMRKWIRLIASMLTWIIFATIGAIPAWFLLPTSVIGWSLVAWGSFCAWAVLEVVIEDEQNISHDL